MNNTRDYDYTRSAPTKLPDWPDHWRIKLFGFGDGDTGDVVTRDGEIIGIWTADENDHCSFTPNGYDKPILFNPFLGLLCAEIAAWHEMTENAFV